MGKYQDMLKQKSQEKNLEIRPPELPCTEKIEYSVIDTISELETLVKHIYDTCVMSFDFETSANTEEKQRHKNKINSLNDKMEKTKRKNEILFEKIEASKAIKLRASKEVKVIQKEIDAEVEYHKKAGLDPHRCNICTISISCKPDKTYVVFLHHKLRNLPPDVVWNTLQPVFSDPKILKIAYNLQFESKMLLKHDIYIQNVSDPMIMAVRLNLLRKPNQNPYIGLKKLTAQLWGYEMLTYDSVTEGEWFSDLDPYDEKTIQYAGDDAVCALWCHDYLKACCEQVNIDNATYSNFYEWLKEIEMPFMRALAMMTYNGVPFDSELVAESKAKAEVLRSRSLEMLRVIGQKYGVEVDPGSTGKTLSVQALLFEKLGAPILKRSDKTGKPSMDEETLKDTKEIVSEFSTEKKVIEIIETVQKLTTLMSTHIDGRIKYLNPVTDRIHAEYSTFTSTGRCNSSKPNQQNTPRPAGDQFKTRNFVYSPEGKILYLVDFSGFELRLMAWASNDATMIELFNNNADLHKATACTMTGKKPEDITKEERTMAKAGNFGICYGGTEHALRTTIKKMGINKTLDDCLEIIQAVKRTYPGIEDYQRRMVNYACNNGYVQTIYGFRRMLPEINSRNPYDRSSAERQAINTPIQGSAADIMKRCQNEFYDLIAKKYQGKIAMIAQIHDEIMFECDKDLQLLREFHEDVKSIMEKPPIPGFPVPVSVDASLADRWAEKIGFEEYIKTMEE